MGRYDGLKNWQPGQSGNPAGRKKGSKNLKTRIKRFLEMKAAGNNSDPDTGEQLDNYDQIIYTQMMKAIEGDNKAFNDLLDRDAGKAVQAVDVTATNRNPIEELSKEELKKLSQDIVKRLAKDNGTS